MLYMRKALYTITKEMDMVSNFDDSGKNVMSPNEIWILNTIWFKFKVQHNIAGILKNISMKFV